MSPNRRSECKINNTSTNDNNECTPQKYLNSSLKKNDKRKNCSLKRYYQNTFNMENNFPGEPSTKKRIKRKKGDNESVLKIGGNKKKKPGFKKKKNQFKKFKGTSKYQQKNYGFPNKSSNFDLNGVCEQLKTLIPAGKDLNNDSPIFKKDPDDLFKWLLYPVSSKDFTLNYWEKSPLFIDRCKRGYYNELNFTTNILDKLLRDNTLLFSKNIDITTYTDGVRETHNPVGRALPHIVWDFFKNGCSVRLLNPQTFVKSVYKLNEKLQKYFNGFVGANVYLTPPNSQGFAPHYDDIEAFVLQLQGCKYWKIYQPRTKNEVLPRYSSPNFTEEEVGQPLLEVALRPGDLLYFPRGFIHQASTRDELSLHITLSAYQCTSYIDLVEKLLPDALSKAAKAEVELREGLPLDYSTQFGLVSFESAKKKKNFKSKIMNLMRKVLDHVDIDAAVDSLVAKSLHDQLPPYFDEDMKRNMVYYNRTRLDYGGSTMNVVQLQLSTSVRLSDPKICRLVKNEDGKYLLYHSINNSMEYHGNDEEFLEVPEESVKAFKMLCKSYPNFMKVMNLPIADDEAKWSFANSLWEVGLLRTLAPIQRLKTNFSGDLVEADVSEEKSCSDDDDDDDNDDDDDDGDDDDDETNNEVSYNDYVNVENDNQDGVTSYIMVDSYSIDDERDAGSKSEEQAFVIKDDTGNERNCTNVCVDISDDNKVEDSNDDIVIVE